MILISYILPICIQKQYTKYKLYVQFSWLPASTFNNDIHYSDKSCHTGDILDVSLTFSLYLYDASRGACLSIPRKQLDQTRDNKLSELDGLMKQLRSTLDDLSGSKMPKVSWSRTRCLETNTHEPLILLYYCDNCHQF